MEISVKAAVGEFIILIDNAIPTAQTTYEKVGKVIRCNPDLDAKHDIPYVCFKTSDGKAQRVPENWIEEEKGYTREEIFAKINPRVKADAEVIKNAKLLSRVYGEMINLDPAYDKLERFYTKEAEELTKRYNLGKKTLKMILAEEKDVDTQPKGDETKDE